MLKRIAVAATLAFLCAVVAVPVAAPAQRVALTSLESGLLVQLNAIRAEHGLVPLTMSVRLTEAAGEHSKQMAADGFFQHSSANGTAFWKRIGRWYGASGYGHWSVGENLLWSSPRVGPTSALRIWMGSAEHRANILTPAYRQIGISALHVARAPGVYHDLEVTIITTDFGVRY